MIRSRTAWPTEPPPSWTPKSPCTAFSSQIANCTGSGLVEAEPLALGGDELVAAASKVRSSRLPTRISAASPGRALAIANVIVEIASRTPSSERTGVRKRISRRRRGATRPPPALVRAVGIRPCSTRRGRHRRIAGRRQRRVDALEVLRGDVLVRRDHRVEHGRLRQHQPLHRLQRRRVLRLVRRRRTRCCRRPRAAGIAPFGYFGGFFSSVAFIM